MTLDALKQVDVPYNQVAFRGSRRAEPIGVQQLQSVPGQQLGLLKGVVRIAHGAHSGKAGLYLPPQLIPQDAQGVLLSPHLVKALNAVAVAAAVAVDAPVAAPAVEVQRVVGAEPLGGFISV